MFIKSTVATLSQINNRVLPIALNVIINWNFELYLHTNPVPEELDAFSMLYAERG